jgi:hypothetical protein
VEEIFYVEESRELSEEDARVLYGREEEKPRGRFLCALFLATPVLIFLAACGLGYLLFSIAE